MQGLSSLRLFRTLAVRPGMSTVEHPSQVFRFDDGSLLLAYSKDHNRKEQTISSGYELPSFHLQPSCA